MKNNRVLLLAALAVFASETRCLRADVVLYNTFGPGQTYNHNLGDVVSGSTGHMTFGYSAVAQNFTPTQTANLSQVVVGFGSGGLGPLDLDFFVTSDAGGLPGSTVENLGKWTVIGGQPLTLNSAAHPVLTAGTSYWLTLQVDDPKTSLYTFWGQSSPASIGSVAGKNSPNVAWGLLPSPSTQDAFAIQGTVAVPEPSSFFLLGATAAVGWGGWRWRRQRRRRDSTSREAEPRG
jgi:hypothetical protein